MRNIAEGRAVNIDVGDVNGRVFLNNISLGLYPAFVQARGRCAATLGPVAVVYDILCGGERLVTVTIIARPCHSLLAVIKENYAIGVYWKT